MLADNLLFTTVSINNENLTTKSTFYVHLSVRSKRNPNVHVHLHQCTRSSNDFMQDGLTSGS